MAGWLEAVTENVVAVAGELPESHVAGPTFHEVAHDHNRYRVRPRVNRRLVSDLICYNPTTGKAWLKNTTPYAPKSVDNKRSRFVV